MPDKLTKQEIELFDRVIKFLGAAIKNSELYPATHPSFVSSVRLCKDHFDRWLARAEKIELGITQKTILLDGATVKEDDDLYNEVADYLHGRGIIALAVARGVTVDELTAFLTFTRARGKAARKGEDAHIPATEHLKIKEIDYSALLGSARDGVVGEEKGIWQSLTAIEGDLKSGALPPSKKEFIDDFLKDTKRSATVLNKIYKDALQRVDEKGTVNTMRSTIAGITKYFEKHASTDAGPTRKDLADIILNLDPNLVANLFQEGESDGAAVDLSREVLKDFNDDMVADFIVSLVGNEGKMNENLLKFFDKLNERSGSGDMAQLVANKLFDKKLLDKNVLSKLQGSIKEVFKRHPENTFLSQMYTMTVETFIDKTVGGEAVAVKYQQLVQEYVASVSGDGLARDEIRLLANLVWLEDDPARFKELSASLTTLVAKHFERKFVGVIREVWELYATKLRPEQTKDPVMREAAGAALAAIGAEKHLASLIAMVAAGDDVRADALVIMRPSAERSAALALDAVAAETDRLRRERIGALLVAMGGGAARAAGERLEAAVGKNEELVRFLFGVIAQMDAAYAATLGRAMVRSPDRAVRLEALRSFTAPSADDAALLIDLLAQERDAEVRAKISILVLAMKDQHLIDRLFAAAGRGGGRYRALADMVKLCGDYKIAAATDRLIGILAKRPFFGSKDADTARTACVVSLAQIATPEAKEAVRRALKDRSEPVRRMAKIILDLEANRSSPDQAGGV